MFTSGHSWRALDFGRGVELWGRPSAGKRAPPMLIPARRSVRRRRGLSIRRTAPAYTVRRAQVGAAPNVVCIAGDCHAAFSFSGDIILVRRVQHPGAGRPAKSVGEDTRISAGIDGGTSESCTPVEAALATARTGRTSGVGLLRYCQRPGLRLRGHVLSRVRNVQGICGSSWG